MIARRKPLDSRIERQICQGLIISERFIREIKPVLSLSGLQLPFAKTVAKWCIEFYDSHQSAPGRTIQDIFVEKRKHDLDEDQAELIEEFLTSISDEYEQQDTFNVKYYLEKAEIHLKTVSLQNLAKEISSAVVGGRIEEAEALVKGYERISRPESKGVDPINDSRVIANAFEENSGDKLFKLPGALGNALGDFERGGLYAYVGAAGTGKTWWLMLTALKALFAGFNVIFFSLEMSEKQMIKRIWHYINGLPTIKWAGELLLPIWDCEHNQQGTCDFKNKRLASIDLIKNEDSGIYIPKTVKEFESANPNGYKPCTECMGSRHYQCTSWFKKIEKRELTIARVLQKKQAIKRSALIRGSKFHLVEFPSGQLTMAELRAYLYNREQYHGEVYDFGVTDYGDKFKPEQNYGQYRHGINEIWEGHKGLAQEKNMAVLTASQSNTSRTGKEIKAGDWAEDIRKKNLVDAGMSLNMTDEQKLRGIMQCGMMKQRHDFFDASSSVMVLHQLKIGRPLISSY